MKLQKIPLVILLSLMGQLCLAQNPIFRDTDSNFLYVCDPAAEVFNGKVYVYCSHDQPDANNYEGMKDYVVLESSDLKTWINHGVSLDPQLDEGFEYAQSNMNAPDAAYKDGWYYWYFPSDVTHVGVAKSRTPIGPWESAVDNEITSIFDPTVFVDDDGQAYIYGNDHWIDFGDQGSHIMGAKLKDNMVELDGPWIRLSEETVNEAVHVFKRNGIYYFSARVGRDTPYWMADSPLPQYATYKGILAPNSPHSPNHTSAIEFNDEWYLFYHRGDVNGGSRCKRSVCFDKMTFREDGTIEPVVYTLDDDVTPKDPVYPKYDRKKKVPMETSVIVLENGDMHCEAEDFTEQSGTKVVALNDGGKSQGLGRIKDGAWTSYPVRSFGRSASPFTFRARVSAPEEGGTIVLRINSPTGLVIGTMPVPATGGWDSYQTISTTVNRIRFSQTLYLCYEGVSKKGFNLNWFGWTPSVDKGKSH